MRRMAVEIMSNFDHNLLERYVLAGDRTHDPWICSQACCRLRNKARRMVIVDCENRHAYRLHVQYSCYTRIAWFNVLLARSITTFPAFARFVIIILIPYIFCRFCFLYVCLPWDKETCDDPEECLGSYKVSLVERKAKQFHFGQNISKHAVFFSQKLSLNRHFLKNAFS